MSTREFSNFVDDLVNYHNANLLYKDPGFFNNKNNYNSRGELKALLAIDAFRRNPTYQTYMKMMKYNYGNTNVKPLGNRLKKYNTNGLIKKVEKELKPRPRQQRKPVANRVALRRLFG